MPSTITAATLEPREHCCHYIFLDTKNLTVYPLTASTQRKVLENPQKYHNWKLKEFDELNLTMLGLYEQDYYKIIWFKLIQMDLSKSSYYESQTSKMGCKYPSELNQECKVEPNYDFLNTVNLTCIRDYFNNEQLKPIKAPFLYTSQWPIKAMEQIHGRHKNYIPSSKSSTTINNQILYNTNI